jgi:translation elongation factor P/translation initiation factor 5A
MMMKDLTTYKELTFSCDSQLNDQEDYIKEGTKVKVYSHPLKKNGAVAVIIEKAFSHEGKELNLIPHYEWFLNVSFTENY